MSRKRHWLLLILTVILLGFSGSGAAQEKAPAPAPQEVKAPPGSPAQEPASTPDPKQVLHQMCDYLKNQSQFSFKAETYNDRIYAEGRKLQYGMDMEAFFRRPDKFRVNGSGDRENKELIFDGKNLTLYDKNKNHYGVIEAPGDMDAALDKAHKEYGLRVGLAELGANRCCEHVNQDLTNALYVGPSKVRGVLCHHLAFDKKNVHFQLWVEAGDKPLLRKVVVTQKKLPYAPQWTAFISDWNFTPQLADNLFTFTPPDGAQKIKFIPVKEATTPAPKETTKKKKGGAS
jgi:hypothetical protein